MRRLLMNRHGSSGDHRWTSIRRTSTKYYWNICAFNLFV